MSGKVTTKLYIGNLPDFCRREELLAKFEKFGNVVEFDIVSNFGFAHYDKPDEARAAADALNETVYNGNTLKVELSHSKVRQRPGMGDREGCYRCGKEGHWSKDCPRGPRRPKREYRDGAYDDPYYRDPYEDPYYRSRYLPPPPSYTRYDPYYDPYDRRPLPSRDPYMRERLADPYSRADPYYYARRSPPPSSASVSVSSARDPYGKDPYGKDPYGKDPYGKDPYGKDPYGKDPYGARPADTRDPYDDYLEKRRAYSAAAQSAAYPKTATGSSSSGYGMSGAAAYSAAQPSTYSGASNYSVVSSSNYNSSSSAASKFNSVQSSRVPGPY